MHGVVHVELLRICIIVVDIFTFDLHYFFCIIHQPRLTDILFAFSHLAFIHLPVSMQELSIIKGQVQTKINITLGKVGKKRSSTKWYKNAENQIRNEDVHVMYFSNGQCSPHPSTHGTPLILKIIFQLIILPSQRVVIYFKNFRTLLC